jgi:hypothetical protein
LVPNPCQRCLAVLKTLSKMSQNFVKDVLLYSKF